MHNLGFYRTPFLKTSNHLDRLRRQVPSWPDKVTVGSPKLNRPARPQRRCGS
jgi:hypothetical protein